MKRAVVKYIAADFGYSKARACRLTRINRSSLYYRSVKKDDKAIRKRLHELALERRRNGCPMFHAELQDEGLVRNHKKTERIYREEGLSLRVRKRKKRNGKHRRPLEKATRKNETWSIDFMSDSLNSGRRYRILTIVDNYTRECPALEVDTSLGGLRVAEVLSRLAREIGLPKTIRLDNGPEFISKAMEKWAGENGVRLNFINPGKPMENAYVESFNGRLRDECLNVNYFSTKKQAIEEIERWRIYYNTKRPHGSLGYLTPNKFAKKAASLT